MCILLQNRRHCCEISLWCSNTRTSLPCNQMQGNISNYNFNDCLCNDYDIIVDVISFLNSLKKYLARSKINITIFLSGRIFICLWMGWPASRCTSTNRIYIMIEWFSVIRGFSWCLLVRNWMSLLLQLRWEFVEYSLLF